MLVILVELLVALLDKFRSVKKKKKELHQILRLSQSPSLFHVKDFAPTDRLLLLLLYSA